MEAPRKRLSASSSSSAITNLPSHILMEILCRLPVKTLVASKWVCKSWLHLITDPNFTKLHQATAPIEVFLYERYEMSFIQLYAGSFNVQNSSQFLDLKIHALFQFKKFKVCTNNAVDFKRVSEVFHYTNCCNGLLCFRNLIHGFAVIWNPITSEVATFRSPKRRLYWSTVGGYGLGFSRKANRFKLLRVLDYKERNSSEREVIAEICIIERGCTWKELGPLPSFARGRDFSTQDLLHSAFLQDALHWIQVDGESLEIAIITFNFENEQFGKVPLPPHLHKVQRDTEWLHKLGILSGCLFITEITDVVNIWLMKEYGVQDSWTKVCPLEFPRPDKYCSRWCVPVTDLDNGKILLTSSRSTNSSTNLFLCNPDLKSIRGIGSCSKYLEMIAFRPSLVRLKYSMMGYKVHEEPRCHVSKHVVQVTRTPSWWKSSDLDEEYLSNSRHQRGSDASPRTDQLCIAGTGEESRVHVSPVSESSIQETAEAVLERQEGTRGLTTGAGGESQGHIGEMGLVQNLAPVISSPETSKAELSHQEESKTPLINDGTCIPCVRKESHGINGLGSDQNPASEPAMARTSEPELALRQGSEAPLANNETCAPVMGEEREGRVSGTGLVQSPASFSQTQDPLEQIKTVMEEVLEELRKERQQRQELEERLKNELAKVEPLKEQVQQNAQLKLQNQRLEERLRNEQAKFDELKEQMQQTEQLKQQLEESLRNEKAKVEQNEQLKQQDKQMMLEW